VSERIPWLAIGGGLSLAAAIGHLACIVGGPGWYRFFGAGERMARAAERGAYMPHAITLGIAALLAIWAAYAFSGAGLITRLPLLKPALVVVTAIYLLRGMVVFRPSLLGRPDLSDSFLLWSSIIVLAIGTIYAIGTWRAWSTL
jgi:hypothetical protein